jgi:glycosyltransferase involved in cell wall biosynthesis
LRDFKVAVLLSVIVPCYNEAAVLAETHRRLPQEAAVDDGVGERR